MFIQITLFAGLASQFSFFSYVDAQLQGSNIVPLGGASVALICPNGNYMQFTSIAGNNVMSCASAIQPDVGPFAMLNNFNVDSNGTGSAQALTDGGTYYMNVQGHGATEFMTATPYNRPNDDGDYTLQTSTYGGPSGTGFHNYECAFNFYIQPDGRYKIQAIANNGPYDPSAMPIYDGPDEGYWSVQSDQTIFTPNTVGPTAADIFSIVLAPSSTVKQSFATSDNLDSTTEFTIQNSVTGSFWAYANGAYSASASQASASTFKIANSTIHAGLNGLYDLTQNQYVSIPSNSSGATGSTGEVTRETEMIIVPVGSQQYVIWTQTNPGAYLVSSNGGLYPTGSEPEINTFVAMGATLDTVSAVEPVITSSSTSIPTSSSTSPEMSSITSSTAFGSSTSTSTMSTEGAVLTSDTSSFMPVSSVATVSSETQPPTTSASMAPFTTVASPDSLVSTFIAIAPSPMANNGAAAAVDQTTADIVVLLTSSADFTSSTMVVSTASDMVATSSPVSTSAAPSMTTFVADIARSSSALSMSDALLPGTALVTDVMGQFTTMILSSSDLTIETSSSTTISSSTTTSSSTSAQSMAVTTSDSVSTTSQDSYLVSAAIVISTHSPTSIATRASSEQSSSTSLTFSTTSTVVSKSAFDLGSLGFSSAFRGYQNVSSSQGSSSSTSTTTLASASMPSVMSLATNAPASACGVVLASYSCTGSPASYGASISATRAQACADSCSANTSCLSFLIDAQGTCTTFDTGLNCSSDATTAECVQIAGSNDTIGFTKISATSQPALSASFSSLASTPMSIVASSSNQVVHTVTSSSSSLSSSSLLTLSTSLTTITSLVSGSGAGVAALPHPSLTASISSLTTLPVSETYSSRSALQTQSSANVVVPSPLATSSAHGTSVLSTDEDISTSKSIATEPAITTQASSAGGESVTDSPSLGSGVSAVQVTGNPINVSTNIASSNTVNNSGTSANMTESATSLFNAGETENTYSSAASASPATPVAAALDDAVTTSSVTFSAMTQSTLVTKVAGEVTQVSTDSVATAAARTGGAISNNDNGVADVASTLVSMALSSSTIMPSVSTLPASTSDSSALTSTMSCLAAVLSVLFFI